MLHWYHVNIHFNNKYVEMCLEIVICNLNLQLAVRFLIKIPSKTSNATFTRFVFCDQFVFCGDVLVDYGPGYHFTINNLVACKLDNMNLLVYIPIGIY